MLENMFEIDQAIHANRAAQQRDQVIGLISSVFGSLLLLFANLIDEIGEERNAL